MSFFNSPKVPSADATVSAQQSANSTAQRQSMIDQYSPLGSSTYAQTGVDPATGAPTYGLTTTLSPQQQKLFDTLQNSKGVTQNSANSLFKDTAGMYSEAPNFDDTASGITGRMMDRWSQEMRPEMTFQSDHLDTKLRNQGLVPGSEAYDNAMRQLRTSQGRTVSSFLAQVEPQAYQQAITSYNEPFNMAAKMAQFGAPGDLKASFQDTSGLRVAPTNVADIYKNNWEQQNKANSQNASGWGNLGSAALSMAPMLMGLPPMPL